MLTTIYQKKRDIISDRTKLKYNMYKYKLREFSYPIKRHTIYDFSLQLVNIDLFDINFRSRNVKRVNGSSVVNNSYNDMRVMGQLYTPPPFLEHHTQNTRPP